MNSQFLPCIEDTFVNEFIAFKVKNMNICASSKLANICRK